MNAFSTWGDAFAQVIAGGMANLVTMATGVTYGLITFALSMIGIAMALRSPGGVNRGAKLVILGSVYLFVVQNIQAIGEKLMESAVIYGLAGGGSSANPNAFLNSPDTIFHMGFAKATEMFELAAEACEGSYFGCLGNIDVWGPVQLAAWIVLGTYWFVSFMVLATSILFKLSLMAGIVLLPMIVFPPTQQFGMKPITSVVHLSVQLFVLTLVTSINTLVMGLLIIGTDPGIAAVTPVLVGTLIFAGSVIGASRLAYSMTHGALLNSGALLGAPTGMAIAATRGAAGHLDGPMTAAAKKSYAPFAAAANRSIDIVRNRQIGGPNPLGSAPMKSPMAPPAAGPKAPVATPASSRAKP